MRAGWKFQFQLQLRAKIARYGFTVMHVGGACSEPGCDCQPEPLPRRFSYTIGLTEHGHPELLVCGLDAQEGWEVLNVLGHDVAGHGQRWRPGDRVQLGPFGIGSLVAVPDSSERLLLANDFYRERGRPPVAALELLVVGRKRSN